MTNLIERLERAEGPSRELDEAIYELMGGCNHKRTKYYAFQSDTGFTCLDCGKDTYGAKSAPRYTASTDAALTLVPEHMRDELQITTMYQVARVALNLNHGPDDGPHYGSHACNSIPLAICIAALRAREADRG